MMKLEDWIRIRDELREKRYVFSRQYLKSRNGKNKKIRADAEREMRFAMDSIYVTVRASSELTNFLTDDTSDFGRAIAFDEFKNPNHFEYDTGKILDRINKKIEQFKSEM